MVNRVWVNPAPSVTDDRPSRHVVNTAGPIAPGASESDAAWGSYQLGNPLRENIAAVEVFRSISEVPPELRRCTHVWRK